MKHTKPEFIKTENSDLIHQNKALKILLLILLFPKRLKPVRL